MSLRTDSPCCLCQRSPAIVPLTHGAHACERCANDHWPRCEAFMREAEQCPVRAPSPFRWVLLACAVFWVSIVAMVLW